MKISPISRKLIFITLILTGLCFPAKPQTLNSPNPRQNILFNNGWKFLLDDKSNSEKNSVDDSKWRLLNLPHDWSIEGTFDKNAPAGGNGAYLPTGIAWYRKHFQITKEEKQKNISILFDGVYMNSDVWINEHHLGNHPYGYTSFNYDLTPYLNEGENIIAVRVDNSLQPNSRWYSGSGIYRNVWLVKSEPLHISQWGIYITTPNGSKESSAVEVKTSIENHYKNLRKGILKSVVLNSEGKEIVRDEKEFSLDAGNNIGLSQMIEIKSPELWSIESPYLYKLHSVISDGKNIIDEVTTSIGIRRIEFDNNKGFFLNGEHLKINGVCLHHDGGCVGAAVPTQVWRRRLESLKEMGCNAIRTSHNPPAPEFLDLCDEMGFLVMDESFDQWKIGKRDHGYQDYFDNEWKNDLTSMILRDRNHPSIVLWSVGNEIPEQKSENGAMLLRSLVETCHALDSTRPVTSACDNIAADGGAATLDFLNGLDIVGYNYADRWHERRELYYSIDRHDHPEWKMLGTESTSNSGGFRSAYSLGNDPLSVHPDYNFDIIDAEQLWKFVSIHDYVMGDFMWTGIDYLGEAFWPYKYWSFGVLDLCGFPKDGYYFYQSQWTKKPMIHLFPHWNWKGREGQIIPVLCYSNCDAVELFLNGKSFGEKRIEFPRQGHSGAWNKYDKPEVHSTTADLHLQWDVPYEPGVLKAVGKKDGKVVCTEEIHTTGAPSAMRLSVDKNTIHANEQDAANIKIEVVDSDGNLVPTADNLIQFSIEGAGELIGVDNGNPLDPDSFKSDHRKAYNGLCLAVVRSADKTGRLKLNLQSVGLKDASLEIKVIK